MSKLTYTPDFGKLDYSNQVYCGIYNIAISGFEYVGARPPLIHRINEDEGKGYSISYFIDSRGALWGVDSPYRFKKILDFEDREEWLNTGMIPDACIQKLKDGYFQTGLAPWQNNAKKVHTLFLDYVRSEIRIHRLETKLNKKID
jgi:hypothetical protein